ncbi:MAG: protein kinase [Sandaracinaceae bacterium]
MRTQRAYLDGLARLHLIADLEERRALWRQSMATLGVEVGDHRPVPLEGLDPEAVRLSVGAALGCGLLDDLGFLSAAAGAAALYELASVLPLCEERRQIGRRVAKHLHGGDAATFVALATQLAMGSRKALSGPAIRARVALALDLPIGTGTRADALALALTSRHDLANEWLIDPSTGSLPSRRLAARLLERAAREAARRSTMGDETVLGLFERTEIRQAWDRLLGDREPLVWRHVATARGLLSERSSRMGDELFRDLDPSLTPTEWRRAAASLAASVAVNPAQAVARATALLEGPIVARDPGIPAAMLLGLPRAAEIEPEAADALCTALVRSGGLDAAEALLALRQERVGGEFGAWACQMARARLRERGYSNDEDEGTAGLAAELDQDLRAEDERTVPPSLPMHLDAARAAFAEQDARTAYAKAHAVLEELEATMFWLEGSTLSTLEGRRAAFSALRELDGALLETSTLADLLTLGARADDGAATAPLNRYFARLTDWLLRHEQRPIGPDEVVDNRRLRISRMRTLLHTVDADGPWGTGLHAELRERRLRSVRVLLSRVRDDAPSPLTRVVTAAAARACDALMREELGELSDVFLAVVAHLETAEGLITMAEASMVPEMERVFRAYATLVERTERGARQTKPRVRATLDALRTLVSSFPTATSPRVDALQRALFLFTRAIESVMGARSLTELVGDVDGSVSRVADLEHATRLLFRLMLGARRRLGQEAGDPTGVAGPALRVLDIALERAARGDRESMGEAIASSLDALHEDLPAHLAEVAASALVRTMKLPKDHDDDAPRDSYAAPAPRASPLPPWLPPSRTLGGFYVLRKLGAGAVGSVFIARRAEEKKDATAASFALKVPEYSGAAARTLSEDEFMRLFREEAGALLAIPEQENLARLVTFDAGARPKPILVMELVEGPTLERMLETGAMDVGSTFDMLDGIAAGLAAMHEVGVGHLDVKPSNVILRDVDPVVSRTGVPVLVDFGLAGRTVRPGCATAHYGAPEVWGLVPDDHVPSPTATDVYAIGCLAFELLTGRELIHGASEVAVITAHLSHDGDMDALRWLAQDRDLAPLAEVISACVRQDPRQRCTIEELREGLAAVRAVISERRWPLDIEAAA